MAQYQHLPIYKTTYELLVKITHATANFPKAYKNGFKKVRGLCRAKAPIAGVRQVAHSYFGIFDHADAYKLQGLLSALLHQSGYGAAVPSRLNQARFPL